MLESVESYLAKINPQINSMATTAQEKLMLHQQARDSLYRSIVVMVPQIARDIIKSDLEKDPYAQGLWIALCNHCKDPVFVKLLMDFLQYSNNPEYNRATAAILTKIASQILKDKKNAAAKAAATTTKKDSNKIEGTSKPGEIDNSDVAHIYNAVRILLSDVQMIVRERCGNLSEAEALSIAACLCMNSKETIDQILNSDLPVTAQLFDIVSYRNPTNLLVAALTMEHPKIAKPTQNQTAFLESLKRWVYDKLNSIPELQCSQFLTSVYGPNPTQKDLCNYFINVKDCGKQYSNLLAAAMYLIK
jgi:hypothetical protein